jgi:hypothetical protein
MRFEQLLRLGCASTQPPSGRPFLVLSVDRGVFLARTHLAKPSKASPVSATRSVPHGQE